MTRKEFIKSLNLKSAHVGSTIYVYDSGSAEKVEKQVKHALEVCGQSLHHSDGSKEFITYDVIHDHETNTYIWDKSGDRVKHNKVRHIVQKDGTHTTEIIGTTFRTF